MIQSLGLEGFSFLLWPLYVFMLFVLRFSSKVSSVHVHSLGIYGLGEVILRLQHMLLQTFSAGHRKTCKEWAVTLYKVPPPPLSPRGRLRVCI